MIAGMRLRLAAAELAAVAAQIETVDAPMSEFAQITIMRRGLV
jgi:hypothetical protein